MSDRKGQLTEERITARMFRDAALDVCAVCGMWPGWGDHDDNPGFRMAVGGSYHPYQPLVAP